MHGPSAGPSFETLKPLGRYTLLKLHATLGILPSLHLCSHPAGLVFGPPDWLPVLDMTTRQKTSALDYDSPSWDLQCETDNSFPPC